jgi:hypothetical protein
MDSTPDPLALDTAGLKLLLAQLIRQEQELSYRRQVLHAKIDALRRELVDRFREGGDHVIFGPDALGPGPSGVREPRRPHPHRGSDGVALPEPE